MTIRYDVSQTDLDTFSLNNLSLYGHMNSGRPVDEGEYPITTTGEARVGYEQDVWGEIQTVYAYFDYIYLKANDGYSIVSASIQDFVGENALGQPMYETYNLIIVDGGNVAEIRKSIKPESWDLSVSESVVVIDFYKFTEDDINKFFELDIDVKLNGDLVNVNDIMVGGDELILNISVDNNYAFFEKNSETSVNFKYLNDVGEEKTINFILSEDDKKAALSLLIPEDYETTSSFNLDYIIYDVSGMNNIYVTNKETLKSINSERYTVSSISGEPPKDWGEFILSVKKYPFKIPNNYLGESEKVLLADRELDTLAPVIINENLIINIGDITVNGVNDNSLDYINSKCVLHLPFIKPVELDVNYVIGSTINVKYKVSLNSGDVLVLVSSDVYGGVFAQFNDKLGFDIPYIANSYVETTNVFNIDSSVYNDVKQCYVELITYDSPLDGDVFNIPVKDYGSLNNRNGYFEVTNINLKTSCSSDERNQLISVLKNGVIIL